MKDSWGMNTEQKEAELWSSGDQEGGPAAWGKGMACEAQGEARESDRQATRTAALTTGLLA